MQTVKTSKYNEQLQSLKGAKVEHNIVKKDDSSENNTQMTSFNPKEEQVQVVKKKKQIED